MNFISLARFYFVYKRKALEAEEEQQKTITDEIIEAIDTLQEMAKSEKAKYYNQHVYYSKEKS